MNENQPEPATEAAQDRRELMIHIWYPAAKAGGQSAAYLTGAERLKGTPAEAAFKNLFGPSWPAIASKAMRTHSFEGAPLLGGARLPILIFSPGGGVPVAGYTSQMEDLASHGYVVLGVDHTYDAPAVLFPDGRVVTPERAFWDRLRRGTANPEDFEKRVTELHVSDVRFVIDKLTDLATNSASIFASRLDLAWIGVFGHSRGGRTAATVCQADARVKACLSQDGNWSWHPFWLDRSGRRLKQAFMMLDHLDPELPDEVFQKMGVTREDYARRRSARQAEASEKLYGTVTAGSYHVTIKIPGISHNSFSDIRQLGRADAGTINGWPKDVQATTPHARILQTITAFTRAFFDRHVRGLRSNITELPAVSEAVADVRRYGPTPN